MTTAPSITVSFPLGLFGSASMNVPPQKDEPSTRLPVKRELLDMPNLIPDMEGLEDDLNLDDV